jgi:hypothetical protein
LGGIEIEQVGDIRHNDISSCRPFLRQ